MKTSNAVYPKVAGDGDAFSREEQAAALVKAFFHLTKEWGLGTDEARALLGFPGKSRFYDLRNGLQRAVSALSEDEMDRLAYLAGIYAGLGILFSPENTLNWLRNPAVEVEGFTRPWGATAPLAHMLSGKMEQLIDVYRYVNGLRGAL